MANRAQRSEKELRAKAKSVYRQLAEVYGQPTWRRHNDPVSELVLTFLSQNTSDVNSHRAFKQLKERYPTWDAVLAASTEELADTIRSGGLADIKAPRIRDALQRILDERGEFSLEFLGSLPVKQAQRYLTSIKGIGHKSAAIVLLFCFGKPVFPVDTHVHRVSHRLGLVSPKNSREHTQRTWEMLAPAETYYSLHLNLIRHGRKVCIAAKPHCAVCVLQPHCDKYQSDRSEASNSTRR